jgi:hypothetical protein
MIEYCVSYDSRVPNSVWAILHFLSIESFDCVHAIATPEFVVGANQAKGMGGTHDLDLPSLSKAVIVSIGEG